MKFEINWKFVLELAVVLAIIIRIFVAAYHKWLSDEAWCKHFHRIKDANREVNIYIEEQRTTFFNF
jgi:hypothetical protein